MAASAGLRANQQPDYMIASCRMLKESWSAWHRAALMEERATISRNRDMYESLQPLVAGLSDWYGLYYTSVATSVTSSVTTTQSNQTDPAVTVSLGLAASSAASVSQAAEGSTATPAAVTNTVSSSTP